MLDESSGTLGRGRRKKIVLPKATDQSDGTEGSISDNADSDKPVYKVNQEGRYICQLCEKTFKTVSHTFCLRLRLLSTDVGYIFLHECLTWVIWDFLIARIPSPTRQGIYYTLCCKCCLSKTLCFHPTDQHLENSHENSQRPEELLMWPVWDPLSNKGLPDSSQSSSHWYRQWTGIVFVLNWCPLVKCT